MEYLPYIVAASVATALTRFLPYWIFKKRTNSPTLAYLQKTSGLLIMVVLTFYALRGMDFSGVAHGAAAVACLALAFVLQAWRKNFLLSIAVPTITYMGCVSIF